MEMQLTLEDKTYNLSSSVFTIIEYKKIFDEDIYNDFDLLTQKDVDVTTIIVVISKILYALARPSLDDNFSYNQFTQELPVDCFFDEEKVKEIMTVISKLLPKRDKKKVPVKNR